MRLLIHSTHFNFETDERTITPGRTLRSAKKKPMFTSIQEAPRGIRHFTGGQICKEKSSYRAVPMTYPNLDLCALKILFCQIKLKNVGIAFVNYHSKIPHFIRHFMEGD